MGRRATHPVHPDADLVSGTFWAGDHHSVFTWMRANAPLYWDEPNGVWGVTRYADLRAMSKDPATFSSAAGIRPDSGPQPMMVDMDDPRHWLRRKLVNKGFTPHRVRDQAAWIRQLCDELIDRVCEKGECDFVWDIAAPLPLIVIGDSLGVAPEDRDDLLRWSDTLLRGLTGRDDEALTAAMEAYSEYTAYAGRVIADRRRAPRDDLMSVLVDAEVDGDRLDHDELVHESLLLLIGGDETTRHVLSGGIYQLVTHPDQWAKVAADPAVLPTAVEEMLRWVSPVKNMCRAATRDVELHGQRIAAGDKLMLLYPSANRDESVFDDPFRFDVERHPNEHVAFGFGTHFCLGNSLARLELATMVERVVARLPDLRLADDVAGEHDLHQRAANFISGYERMPVTFTPTAPLG